MKLVIQRVNHAEVTIKGNKTAGVGEGLLILLGIAPEDTLETVLRMSQKIVQLRIFSDTSGKMTHSVKDVDGEILLVSQFTLLGRTDKGNRPSFVGAAKPKTAIPLYEAMITQLTKNLGKPISTGTFGADMQIDLCNDGPVTIVMEA